MRIPGSAKLLSAATHECVTSGHGQMVCPHEVSDVEGDFQCT